MRYFLFGILFLTLSSTANASTNASVEVIGNTGDKGAYKITDLSAVPTNSQIRVQINIETDGKLNVEFKSSSGDKKNIVTMQSVKAGDVVLLPSEDKWFDLDDQPGKAQFDISIVPAKGVKEKLNFSFTQVDKTIDNIDLSKLSGTLLKSTNKENLKIAAAAGSGLPNWLPKSVSAAISASQKPALEVRGEVGAKLYKEYADAVVLVVTKDGIGTGSVIDKSGTILTNWHVVSGYENVAIVFKPPLGEKPKDSDVYKATVKRVDQVADLALLKITKPPKIETPITIGKLENVQIGADVHAIGHPTGEAWTYTQGIVSQVRADYEWQADAEYKHKATIIQTQTPINPGNSGGPLLSDAGELIGVNSFINKEAQGINFAVSTKDVMSFLGSKKDRIAEKLQQKCEPTFEKVENTGAVGDTNCDGKFDTIFVDKNQDGVAEYVLADCDYDGAVETKIIRSERGGALDLWLIDTDGDRVADVGGVDLDSDFKPDKFNDVNAYQVAIR